MNGIIVIDKPKDYTSFDVVAVMRRLCKTKKIGHAGTLDPLATGVLPILVGNATKAQAFFPNTDKTYIASFKLGLVTDTQDITGRVIKEVRPSVTRDQLTSALSNFRGDILQIPPMYSAVKKNGKKLYDLARKGIEVEREARQITISELELRAFDETSFTGELLVSCSKGTYIRTLCADLGDALGCGAVLTDLRRINACGFDISQSITLEKAKTLADAGTLDLCVIPTYSAFEKYPVVKVTDSQAVRFKNGGNLSLDRLPSIKPSQDRQYFRVCTLDDTFLGLAMISIEKHELCFLKLFCD